MIRIRVTGDDVAKTRIAFSPLWEVVASIRLLKSVPPHSLHRPWINALLEIVPKPSSRWSELWDLVPLVGYMPDFLTPPPPSTDPDLKRELEELCKLPAAQIRADVNRMVSSSAFQRYVYDRPLLAAREIADMIMDYFAVALKPHWRRIRGLLQAEMFFRARLLAEEGAQAVFDGLTPSVSWHRGVLTINEARYSGDLTLNGRGIIVVPSVFVWPHVFLKSLSPWHTTLRYPPRGVFTLWEEQGAPISASEALASVLGKTRTRILLELSTPASTVELASRLGITPGGISQHLSALKAARLIRGTRWGHSVYYARTNIGTALVKSQDFPS